MNGGNDKYMKFILGKKLGMTQVFTASGDVVPVTRVQAGPCQIVQIKTPAKDNAKAVEIGYAEQKSFRITKPQAGHLKDLTPVRYLRSFTTDNTENINRGDVITVDVFTPGEKVTVEASSKGRGFAGVVKRHHFRGGPASHGHKDNLRAPGSIGAGGVQRVFKGMRMAGRMGGQPVTVKNLEIIEINPELNELYIKGAVPGAKNNLVKIYCPGELIIKKAEIKDVDNSAVGQSVPEIIDEVVNEEKAEVEATVNESTSSEVVVETEENK